MALSNCRNTRGSLEEREMLWEHEKCCGNTSRRRVFPQLFRVLPNTATKKRNQVLYFNHKNVNVGGAVTSWLMLDSGASGPGSNPGQGHCVVFLGKTLYSHGASPPRCINGYRQIVGGNLTNDGDVTWVGVASHSGEVETLLAASCYRNRDKLRQV